MYSDDAKWGDPAEAARLGRIPREIVFAVAKGAVFHLFSARRVVKHRSQACMAALSDVSSWQL